MRSAVSFMMEVFRMSLLVTTTLTSMTAASSCGRRSCHGDVGNIVAGRAVHVSSTCGTADESFRVECDTRETECASRACEPCTDGESRILHPGSQMIDSPFSNHDTYWQSGVIRSDNQRVTVRFDLETAFYFTHLIMVFRTPRPGAMIVERSVDYGTTWQVYQHYALNCRDTFGMDDDETTPGSGCTSRYSNPQPCTRGEVIYRVLNPVNPIDDPYSAESRHLLKLTNLRIQMWKPQSCSACVNDDPSLTRHFAVYDLIVRGTCFCNGHADSCVPLTDGESEPYDARQAVVHGKCLCEHNTAGDHCEKCLALHNDAPWRAGNGDTGEPNQCKRCNCHGHADGCHFDSMIWIMTEGRSGGVCDHCKHNTEGRRCDRCKTGFFRREDAETTDPDVCQECQCNPLGTVSGEVVEKIRDDIDITLSVAPQPCDSVSGQCHCREGVGGRRCDRCLRGYWGLSRQGCQKCSCPSMQCEQVSGECIPDYDDDYDHFFQPATFGSSYLRGHVLDFYNPRYPDDSSHNFPQYSTLREHGRGEMAATWRPHGKCNCTENTLDDTERFCKMNYDYAVKIRVLDAKDDGTDTSISVAVKRVIKQSKVRIQKGRMQMYPESWTVMGCTCPVLMPKSDYIVVGHEDPISKKLMINLNSFVKRWSQTNNWARTVQKIFRSKCY